MNVIPTIVLVSIVRRVSIVRLVIVRLVKHGNVIYPGDMRQ